MAVAALKALADEGDDQAGGRRRGDREVRASTPSGPIPWTRVSDEPTRTSTWQRIEVKVPDIGDFKDVPVIEVLVKPGDTVKAEEPLVTLESDKATMEVPSPRRRRRSRRSRSRSATR